MFEKKAGELSAEDRQKIGTVFSDSGFSEYLTVQQVGRIMQEFTQTLSRNSFTDGVSTFIFHRRKK